MDRPALRVLSIAHTAVSRAAGRRRYEALAADRSLDITLVAPRRWFQFGRWIDADPVGDSAIRTHLLPVRLPRAGPASWHLHVYPGLARLARTVRPDVVHLWEEPWSLVTLQACILARRAGATLVLEVDQNIAKRLPPPFEWIRRHVLAHTGLVLARSDDAAAVVRGAGFRGPVLPIGYGVDEAVFRPGIDKATTPGAPFRLGYLGRLVVEKGLDDVFDALRRTAAAATLAVMGEGPHEAALRARVAALGLADRVSFQPWGTPDDAARFLREQDALVLPTRTTATVKEQFGRVIIEAQACGTPVIGSTCGAIPDVVGAGGWIVPERDAAALALLLAHLAADRAEVAARAADGLRNVAARFTYAAVGAALRRGWQDAPRRRPDPAPNGSPAHPASPSIGLTAKECP